MCLSVYNKNSQADLSLRWAHMSKGAAHFHSTMLTISGCVCDSSVAVCVAADNSDPGTNSSRCS